MPFLTKSNYVSDAEGFAPPKYGGSVACMYAAVDYTMITATTLFTIPRGAVLIDYMVDISTAFDDSGTDLLTVGTVADPDRYVDDLAGGVAGRFRAGAGATTPVTNLWHTPFTEDTAIVFTYTGENTDATEGAGVVALFYILM